MQLYAVEINVSVKLSVSSTRHFELLKDCTFLGENVMSSYVCQGNADSSLFYLNMCVVIVRESVYV